MKAKVAHRKFWRCIWQIDTGMPNRSRRKRLKRLAVRYSKLYRGGVLSQISLKG